MKNWLLKIAEWYKPRDPIKWIMTWIIFQNEKCDDIKTTIFIENFGKGIGVMGMEIRVNQSFGPETAQILSQNGAKTNGSNDLGPMLPLERVNLIFFRPGLLQGR